MRACVRMSVSVCNTHMHTPYINSRTCTQIHTVHKQFQSRPSQKRDLYPRKRFPPPPKRDLHPRKKAQQPADGQYTYIIYCYIKYLPITAGFGRGSRGEKGATSGRGRRPPPRTLPPPADIPFRTCPAAGTVAVRKRERKRRKETGRSAGGRARARERGRARESARESESESKSESVTVRTREARSV